jgi:serine protease Do
VAEPEVPDDRLAAAGLGFRVRELDGDTAERVGLERNEGVVVTEVADDSPASRRRIQPGDVITKINRRPVRTPRDFASAMKDADPRRGVPVTVLSGGVRRFEVLKQAAE